MADKLLSLAERELRAEGGDFLTEPSDADLAWLAAQLAAWPTRVDPDCTTNMRFLMQSAACFILRSLGRDLRTHNGAVNSSSEVSNG